MEGRLHRRLPVVAAAVTLAMVGAPQPAEAAAYEPFADPTVVDVWTNTDEIVVVISTEEHTPGDGTATPGTSRCYVREFDPLEGELWYDIWWHSLDERPYALICDGKLVDVFWIEVDREKTRPRIRIVDPVDLALEMRDEIPVPEGRIKANPRRGLVGVESWFWVDGYDGEPIEQQFSSYGTKVDVIARVVGYEWSFGDGARTASGSPGQPYPARSEVRHTYQRSSAGQPGGVPVTVTYVFEVEYRVWSELSGWSPWRQVSGIRRSTSITYPVREAQAVIQR